MSYSSVLDLITNNVVANGNNEITADVLRPILIEMLGQPNDLIGALDDLETADITNIVNAINSLLSNNIPNRTVVFPINSSGVDYTQDELEWVRDAINNTAASNGVFSVTNGQQMVFSLDVITNIDSDDVNIQKRYYRLTTGDTSVLSLGTGNNIPLMPDGSQLKSVSLSSDLVIDLGDILLQNVEDAFNSSPDQPFTINGDKFVQATQDGESKLWQWIGGDGSFGNSATLAQASYFVDLTSDDVPELDIPTENEILGTMQVQDVNVNVELPLHLYSDFYITLLGDTVISFKFDGLPEVNKVVRFKIVANGEFNISFLDDFMLIYGDTYDGKKRNDIICEIANLDGNYRGEAIFQQRETVV